MGPRSFQIRIWGPKRWPTPTKSGAPCNFCFIKFLPKCTAEAPETPCTPFMHPVPGGGGTVLKPPKNLLTLKDHLLAKFHQYLSAVWISIENILIQCPLPPPWGAQIKKQKNTRLIKFDFRNILFYKYCTILKKKFTPLQVPPSTPATLDPGAKSKIFLHHFVCLVKCFPKWYDMIR